MSAVSLFTLCSMLLVVASTVAVSLPRDLPETHMNVVSFTFMKFIFCPLVTVNLCRIAAS